jgi:hypothetical protein
VWLAAMLVTEGAARGGDDGGLDGGSLVAAKVAVIDGRRRLCVGCLVITPSYARWA